MTEKKTIGYIALTSHKLESPRLHNKPIVPYHKFMALEQRIEKCKQNFGGNKKFIKGLGYIDNGKEAKETPGNSKED